ncbi:hypothetical protein GBAR_LOCUS11626, partial [Geodia barretti]
TIGSATDSSPHLVAAASCVLCLSCFWSERRSPASSAAITPQLTPSTSDTLQLPRRNLRLAH